jgi:hypothetical protein
MRELAIIARGEGPTGARWVVTAGGTAADYATFLKTIYADGCSDEGGFAGPALYPGMLLNKYVGVGLRSLRRIVARADPRICKLRVELAEAAPIDLLPVATDPDVGLVFFAALLPSTVTVVGLVGLDIDGEAVP